MHVTLKQPMINGPFIFKRSLVVQTAIRATVAQAYGIMEKSCACSEVYPKALMKLGRKLPTEEMPRATPAFIIAKPQDLGSLRVTQICHGTTFAPMVLYADPH